MKEIYIFFKEIGIDLIWILSGILGGAIMIQTSKKQLTFWQKVIVVSGGAITANFVTPVAIWLFGMPNTVSGAVSFLVGFFGYEALKRIITKFINKKIKKED